MALALRTERGPVTRAASLPWSRRLGSGPRAVRWVSIAIILAWSLFPLYWSLNTSLMSTSSALSLPPHFFPSPLTFANYGNILGIGSSVGDLTPVSGFWGSLFNTVVEASGATVLTVLIGILGGYAFARMRFPLKSLLFYVVLAMLTLPAYAALIPLYQLMSQIGLVNTYLGIVLVDTASFLPLAMWILYSYFGTIPMDLEEAASVDGASALKALWHVVLPVARPGIVSAAIIVFLLAWGNFLFPLVLSQSGATEPLTVWITSLEGQHVTPFTLLNAGGILAIIVPLVIVAALSRHIVSGLLSGSRR